MLAVAERLGVLGDGKGIPCPACNGKGMLAGSAERRTRCEQCAGGGRQLRRYGERDGDIEMLAEFVCDFGDAGYTLLEYLRQPSAFHSARAIVRTIGAELNRRIAGR